MSQVRAYAVYSLSSLYEERKFPPTLLLLSVFLVRIVDKYIVKYVHITKLIT